MNSYFTPLNKKIMLSISKTKTLLSVAFFVHQLHGFIKK